MINPTITKYKKHNADTHTLVSSDGLASVIQDDTKKKQNSPKVLQLMN